MTTALAWIRKSKGSEDDVGLEEQREKVPALADELADDVEVFDLGVHTGFSTMTRDDPAGLLDQNERVTDMVERLRDGEYSHLVAIDDRRICRDEYFSVIEYACIQGDCEIVYVADVDTDDLTFSLKRRIERDTKEEEIEKSRQAIEAKKKRGDDLGRPKFGMTYNDAGTEQVPGDDFETVREILRYNRMGKTLREIEDLTGVSKSTVANVLDRRQWYVQKEKLVEN
jgi:hypothetical protein